MGKSIEEEIEEVREQMVITGVSNGLLANETILLSRKLDLLINRYNSLKAIKCTTKINCRSVDYENR